MIVFTLADVAIVSAVGGFFGAAMCLLITPLGYWIYDRVFK